MQIPFKGIWEDFFRTPAPIVITTLMALYLGGLAYYHKFVYQPELKFNFYSTSPVKVQIANANDNYVVQGVFNNVIEGDRETISSRKDSLSQYCLDFRVNSPRPALLYIEGEAIEIFLVPDSTLFIKVVLDSDGSLDSIDFNGKTAPICRYYHKKNEVFQNAKLRTSRNVIRSQDLLTYSKLLDSLTQVEYRFLDSQMPIFNLPEWFVDFERNEMIYQKAYLKLSNLSKSTPPVGYLDSVKIDNGNAVFSYYYYLFLNTHLKRQVSQITSLSDSLKQVEMPELQIADTLLKSEVHDVYITRAIFHALQKNDFSFAKSLFEKYKNFKERKYYRFLNTQFSDKKE